MQERVKRSYSLPSDVTNLIDQVHMIDQKTKSDIVAESVRAVCLMRLAIPEFLKSLDNIELEVKGRKR
ncbi:hypothetical protein [Candidatus Methanomassiliicoccus intestinalis]|uniref:hypothetical protein n=1 Tax=Candidatus Methanomassiliicoccus intestinalis TaxID=1406512 RepID=UPI0037DDC1E9